MPNEQKMKIRYERKITYIKTQNVHVQQGIFLYNVISSWLRMSFTLRITLMSRMSIHTFLHLYYETLLYFPKKEVSPLSKNLAHHVLVDYHLLNQETLPIESIDVGN